MEWQAVVMALQILMVAVGWVLFQKAKAELSAQAAETPVLGELRALKSQIKQLLDEIETAGDTASLRLETQCRDAQKVLAELEARIAEAEATHFVPVTPHERGTESFVPLAVSSVSSLGEETAPKKAPRRPKTAPSVSSADSAKIPAPRKAKLTETPAVAEAVALVGMASRRQKVYALSDAGKEMAVIARETEMSVGEVETLIGLRGR